MVDFETNIVKFTRPPPTAVVIFGASGDLTRRKLVPALYNLAHDNLLPQNFFVVGASRTKMSHEEFRKNLKDSASQFSRRGIDEAEWDKFASNVFYHSLDATHPDDYAGLKDFLVSLEKEKGERHNYLYYLSASPEFFGTICSNLKSAGLIENPGVDARRTSVIVEKPFGHDVASAHDLNVTLRQSLAEEQIFRIDHYLGKETVQNILVFRFANGIFEPLWNYRYIDHVEISVCEEIGVGRRAGYFDKTGILRDIVQNHLLQVLSLLCIEAPISLSDASSIRDEKVKVIKSLRRLKPEDVQSTVVRGQYLGGTIAGEAAVAYKDEPGIAKDSQTDTYVAMRLEIDNWRWFGVPFYVRAGKRLPKRLTEITIYFKRAPDSLFHSVKGLDLEQNILTIQIQPNEGISIRVNAKPPGPRLRVRPVVLDFSYGDFFEGPSPEAYERLLLDAMKGDSTLFIRDDEIEAAWAFLEPVFAAWSAKDAPPVATYEAGSWGPEESEKIFVSPAHRWKNI